MVHGARWMTKIRLRVCIKPWIWASTSLIRPTFIGMGRSERLIAQLRHERKDKFFVATKAGRRLPQQTVEGYSRENLSLWIEDSLRNLNAESLDLLQLHCPPTALYYQPEVFGCLDDLVAAGKIQTLWSKRRTSRRGAKGNRVPECEDGADHLQLLPAATGRSFL